MSFQNTVSKREIKQDLRRLLQRTLLVAQEKPPIARRRFIRESLDYIKTYCEKAGKTFIFCEHAIACNQYDIGGSQHDRATLFRGPNEDASVAICVTEKGTLLHRNDSGWRVYCDAGDVAPTRDRVMAIAA